MKIFFKLLLILGIAISIVYYSYSSAINFPFNANGQDIDFKIAKGESVERISANLVAAKIIDSAFYFKMYMRQSKLGARLQAGEYVLSSKLSIKEIAKIISEGMVKKNEKTIAIIDGWNIRDIANYLERENLYKAGDFADIVGGAKDTIDPLSGVKYIDSRDYSFLADKPVGASLEGYLFPDTYRIFENASINDVVRKMLVNFDKKLTPVMREDIKKQNKTIYEIITLASVIEKEVRSLEDKKMVSGIFWDRIKNGQALESCATLAYVLGENKKQYTLEDTKINSPYNTYQNRGLPPGPIANPGLDSIIAAIYPTPNDYNFFLSKFEDGQTVFSRTYEEHLRNKAKFLQ